VEKKKKKTPPSPHPHILVDGMRWRKRIFQESLRYPDPALGQSDGEVRQSFFEALGNNNDQLMLETQSLENALARRTLDKGHASQATKAVQMPTWWVESVIHHAECTKERWQVIPSSTDGGNKFSCGFFFVYHDKGIQVDSKMGGSGSLDNWSPLQINIIIHKGT
jgi:hypothetical protein